MAVGYDEQAGQFNSRYEAWAANMLKASEPKQWTKMVNANYQNGLNVKVEQVGCLHWAYYSIMNFLGKGTPMQYVLCYYQKDEMVPSGGLDFDGKNNGKGFYKTEGLFCLSAVILALVLFFRKWIRGWIDILGQTYNSRNIFYSMFSRVSFCMTWLVIILVLFQLFLAFRSLAQGRRLGKYILNIILILLLPTGFGVIEVIYLVGAAFLHLEVKCGVGYSKRYSMRDYSTDYAASENTYSSAGNDVYKMQNREEERRQREREYEEYEKQRLEEREMQRKEEQRYKILREIDDFRCKISRLEDNNRDLDKGLKAYQQGSWSYNVDLKANRSKFESNLKYIDMLRKKIEKKEYELRRL